MVNSADEKRRSSFQRDNYSRRGYRPLKGPGKIKFESIVKHNLLALDLLLEYLLADILFLNKKKLN